MEPVFLDEVMNNGGDSVLTEGEHLLKIGNQTLCSIRLCLEETGE